MNNAIAVKATLLLGLVSILAGCKNSSTKSETPTSINVSIENAADLPTDAVAKISFFGYSKASDSPTPTLLATKTFDPMSATMVLPLTDDVFKLIEGPGVSAEDEANYFITVYIDADNDGQICPTTDYAYDYTDRTAYHWDGAVADSTRFTIVAVPGTETCQDF